MNKCPEQPTAARNAQKSLKMSCKARYALRILTDIANNQGTGNPTTEAAIAERQGLSQKFLSRIVLPLRDAGFISVRRGSRAGFSLLKKPEEITILDIVETSQGPVQILDCLDSSVACPHKRTCFARRAWGKVNLGIRATLQSITLAEVKGTKNCREPSKAARAAAASCP